MSGTKIHEHNGVTFKYTDEAVADCLNRYSIDILVHVEKIIDNLLLLAEINGRSKIFSVRIKIIKDISDDLSEIIHSISVTKIAKLPE